MKITLRLAAALLVSALSVEAQNWPSFRGPQASGVGQGTAPTTWDGEKSVNVAWKTAIPGLANSSPVVWGDRVFVTTAVSDEKDPTYRMGSYGDVDSVESKAVQTWKVYALDKKTGKVLWEQTATTGVPKVKRHMKATHANSTPATDGKHVVALFGSEGLYCWDTDGKLLWKKDLGTLDAGWFYDPSYQWEYGSSPVLYKDRVIVQADIQKGSFLAAYDLKDGRQVWRTERDEIPSWASPTVVETEKGAEVVTNATKGIRGYDPATGKELWQLKGNSEIVVPTPFLAHGLIFVTSGYAPVQPIYAIRPGARGDITLPEGKEASDHIAWSKKQGGPYMPTPLVYGDHLYVCANNGTLAVYDVKTGERLYRERVAGTGSITVTSSPVAADGKLYISTEDGDVYVVKTGPKFELLAKNPMGEALMSTPAISDGLLIVRGRSHVFALREVKAEAKPAAGR
ncbi:MAG TPA: PQQ-binding-like beta-propeller repeat protein [Thermoanaerobaculia bacterium]|nr:PQQ-binding-like beta-propeller repeat protein [Thermoanaerobaculia bacterium]